VTPVTDAQFSLANLRDIVEPAPPPLWPPAPAVWILSGFLIAGAAILIHHWRRRRRENAYRRAGLAQLDQAGSVHEVSVLLKRVALAAFPRAQVASLWGEDWVGFLHRTCPRGDLSPLTRVAPESPPSDALKQSAAQWIERHERARASGTGSAC
jgi:hypothetical protein